MIKGYMEYQSMVYICEYILEVASPHITIPRIWDVDYKKKCEGDILLGNGRIRKVKGNEKIYHINLFNIVCYILSVSYLFNLINLIHLSLLSSTMST